MTPFVILKRQTSQVYEVVDTQTGFTIAYADGLRSAQTILSDIERIVQEDSAVEEAMFKLGL